MCQQDTRAHFHLFVASWIAAALLCSFVCSRANAQGQVVGIGYAAFGGGTPPPQVLLPAVGIDANNQSVAILADGTVAAWGANNNGQATPSSGLQSVIQVAAGDAQTYCLQRDGSLKRFGASGNGHFNEAATPADLGPVVEVSCGRFHTVARLASGQVRCWGAGSPGTSGQPHFGQSTPPAALQASRVDCGEYFTLAVTTAGRVIGWGQNDYGQCLGSAAGGGAITGSPSGQELRINGQVLTGVLQASGGYAHSAAVLASGTVVAWGSNTAGGQHPQGGVTVVPTGLTGVVQVGCGRSHTVALKSNGQVAMWGSNYWGQLNAPTPPLEGVQQIAVGIDHAVALRSDGSIVCWGDNQQSQCSSPQAPWTDLVEVAGGGFHSMARRSSGQVVCWGGNGQKQCDVPSSVSSALDISGGTIHSMALLPSGQVVAWGYNQQGQCRGTDSTGARISSFIDTSGTPVVIGGQTLTGIVEVAAGHYHSLARRQNGTVVAWGAGLSNGVSPDRGQCIVPSSLSGVTMIDGGDEHSMALRNNGQVVCWGNNDNGQCLGRNASGGAITGSATGQPVQYLGQILANAVHISAGTSYCLAARADGTIAAWGKNEYGQSTVPGGLANVVRVSASLMSSLVLLADGTVRCLSGGNGCTGATLVAGAVSLEAGCQAGHAVALLPASYSQCTTTGGSGTASLAVSGSSWNNVSIWQWSSGGMRVPGSSSTVNLGSYGSVGSTCDAQCATLTANSGSTIIVPVDLTVPQSAQPDRSIDVSGTANLAGRIWLVASGASVLPNDLNIKVLRAGDPQGAFDIIQTTVPPPAGTFLTLVQSGSSIAGMTEFSLVVRPLNGDAAFGGNNNATLQGTAVAAETLNWDNVGGDDLLIAVSNGPSQNGFLQLVENAGQDGLINRIVPLDAAEPMCLAVGPLDSDGRTDAVVGTKSPNRLRIYSNNSSNPSNGAFLPSTQFVPIGPILSVTVIPPSSGLVGLGAGTIGAGTGNSNGSAGGAVTLHQPSGAVIQTVSVPVTPTTTLSRSRRVTTGGASSTTVDEQLVGENGRVVVLTQNGGGVWGQAQSIAVPGKPLSMDEADIDGDGRFELISANAAPVAQGSGSALPVLTLFRGLSTGLSAPVPIAPAGASSGLDVVLLDVDADGDKDIVSVHRTLGLESKAVLIRVDVPPSLPGQARPITIGQQSEQPSTKPLFCARGDMDGQGGEDLFLVDAGLVSLTDSSSAPLVRLRVAELAAPPCVGDLDGSGLVEAADLAMVLAAWQSGSGAADVNGDGLVEGADLALVLGAWGPCPGQ